MGGWVGGMGGRGPEVERWGLEPGQTQVRAQPQSQPTLPQTHRVHMMICMSESLTRRDTGGLDSRPARARIEFELLLCTMQGEPLMSLYSCCRNMHIRILFLLAPMCLARWLLPRTVLLRSTETCAEGGLDRR